MFFFHFSPVDGRKAISAVGPNATTFLPLHRQLIYLILLGYKFKLFALAGNKIEVVRNGLTAEFFLIFQVSRSREIQFMSLAAGFNGGG